MELFRGHKLEQTENGYIVTLYVNEHMTEFADELMRGDSEELKSLGESIQSYISEKLPDLRISAIKLMVGALLIATIPFGTTAVQTVEAATEAAQQAYTTYKVVSGDSLWTISRKYNVTIEAIKTLNNMTTDAIYPDQALKIPATAAQTSGTTYKVVSGDSLYTIAKRFNTTVTAIKTLNNMTTEVIYPDQILKMPAASVVQPTAPAPTQPSTVSSYTVAAGDSLWTIAQRFNTTVDGLKLLNGLTTDAIIIGQILKIPGTVAAPAPALTPTPAPTSQQPYVTYTTHKVASGENAWTISVKYGIPMTELLRANNLTQDSMLQIGQVLKIPVHVVPVMQTPGAKYGENLDWWTGAQYVFPIGKVAKVTDFATGRSFTVKRTIGANHSDTEPLTATDAATIKSIWGGSYSWTPRAVIVEVDGRRIAASMASMPHGIEYIAGNNFTGHFDIHFRNSTRHKDGLVDAAHQAQIRIAAGVTGV